KVYTRFPPEPNGYLHIGHAKAMNFSFNYAKIHGGHTYLRYDDTNPSSEKKEYFDSIRESVEWLGFHPWKVTHASDYFQQLYEYAVVLIKKGLAYVCHMKQEEILESRGGKDRRGKRYNSRWRDRPVAENLSEFQKMKDGEYKEGEAVLRLKMDIESGNPLMWDLVAYRVCYKKHVRTGDRWCIYPMYDFAHCLCDSIENITHSLCTSEFILAREAYFWICDAVGVYKPVQWEYSRLEITNTILSKRNIAKLISLGVVCDWDDPRLFTLPGLRRRGFPPEAINIFVQSLGVTKSNSTIDVCVLENIVRRVMGETCAKRMAVFDPVRVLLSGVGEDFSVVVGEGEERIVLGKEFFIEREDLRYLSSSEGGSVGLIGASVFIARAGEADGDETLLRAVVSEKKPRHFIQWLPCGEAVEARVNKYSRLFTVPAPGECSDVLQVVSKSSLEVLEGCYIDPRIRNVKAGDCFQFLRKGFFCVDTSTAPGRIVLNLTIGLKEKKKEG
ncbi:MAG: glutaminyl-tRNA synthetase, partial [Amphiamblys sp. WSBS2006]